MNLGLVGFPGFRMLACCSFSLQLRHSHHGRDTVSDRRVQPLRHARVVHVPDLRSTQPPCTMGPWHTDDSTIPYTIWFNDMRSSSTATRCCCDLRTSQGCHLWRLPGSFGLHIPSFQFPNSLELADPIPRNSEMENDQESRARGQTGARECMP